MEGRTIARPNPPAHLTAGPAAPPNASMEGRTIARPNRFLARQAGEDILASMEGRTIARPNPSMVSVRSVSTLLQWRAGQLPGQSFNGGPGARPNWHRGDHRAPTTAKPGSGSKGSWPGASMEGRTIARPNSPAPASMEGRTIARPNTVPLGDCPATPYALCRRSQTQRCVSPSGRFNGGPDNCPAKRITGRVGVDASCQWNIARPNPAGLAAARTSVALQWRAGQLPGQTGRPSDADVPKPIVPASMEGRTIARPNVMSVGTDRLQWRAGQLPGQTSRVCSSLRAWL